MINNYLKHHNQFFMAIGRFNSLSLIIKISSKSFALNPKAILLFTDKISVSDSDLKKPLSVRSKKILMNVCFDKT